MAVAGEIAQIMLAHAVVRIFAAVDEIEPARALREVKFSEARCSGRLDGDVVADDAAPERCKVAAGAEIAVDRRKVLLLRGRV